MTTFNKKREYEWLIISESYFQSALINARILNKKLQSHKFGISQGSRFEYCLKEIYGDYQQSCEYLIFPILFNFKHGIEIYLKSMIGIKNSEFSFGHDLLYFLEVVDIKDEKIKNIIEKYAYSLLLLPNNKIHDTKNQFERYPQGSPYDNLCLFPAINEHGQNISEPENIGFEGYTKWMKKNNLKIKSIITQEKINELIEDIEFLILGLRKLSTQNNMANKQVIESRNI